MVIDIKFKLYIRAPSVSKDLLVFYHKCCSLIGWTTRYLVLNSQ